MAQSEDDLSRANLLFIVCRDTCAQYGGDGDGSWGAVRFLCGLSPSSAVEGLDTILAGMKATFTQRLQFHGENGEPLLPKLKLESPGVFGLDPFVAVWSLTLKRLDVRLPLGGTADMATTLGIAESELKTKLRATAKDAGLPIVRFDQGTSARTPRCILDDWGLDPPSVQDGESTLQSLATAMPQLHRRQDLIPPCCRDHKHGALSAETQTHLNDVFAAINDPETLSRYLFSDAATETLALFAHHVGENSTIEAAFIGAFRWTALHLRRCTQPELRQHAEMLQRLVRHPPLASAMMRSKRASDWDKPAPTLEQFQRENLLASLFSILLPQWEVENSSTDCQELRTAVFNIVHLLVKSSDSSAEILEWAAAPLHLTMTGNSCRAPVRLLANLADCLGRLWGPTGARAPANPTEAVRMTLIPDILSRLRQIRDHQQARHAEREDALGKLAELGRVPPEWRKCCDGAFDKFRVESVEIERDGAFVDQIYRALSLDPVQLKCIVHLMRGRFDEGEAALDLVGTYFLSMPSTELRDFLSQPNEILAACLEGLHGDQRVQDRGMRELLMRMVCVAFGQGDVDFAKYDGDHTTLLSILMESAIEMCTRPGDGQGAATQSLELLESVCAILAGTRVDSAHVNVSGLPLGQSLEQVAQRLFRLCETLGEIRKLEQETSELDRDAKARAIRCGESTTNQRARSNIQFLHCLVQLLKFLTKFPCIRPENMQDVASNLDSCLTVLISLAEDGLEQRGWTGQLSHDIVTVAQSVCSRISADYPTVCSHLLTKAQQLPTWDTPTHSSP